MKPWRPNIVDRAGRGEACSRIQQLTREVQKYMPGGPSENSEELKRLLSRLDTEKAKFKKLYE